MLSLLRRVLAASAGLLIALPLVLTTFFLTARARGLGFLCTCLRPRPPGDAPPPQALDPRWGAHKWVTVNGLRLHYVESGDPSKPLLLCLHGFPESWYSWRWWLRAFRSTHHVVAIDQRGYGQSDAPGSGTWADSPHYALRHLAADVQALIPALGHARATLAAHDWGVVVAWAAAGPLDRAGQLDGLIVANGPNLNSYHAQAGWRQYLRSLYIAAFQVPWLAEAWLSAGDGALLDHMFLSRGMGVRRREGPCALSAADVEVFKWGMRRPGRLTNALNWYRQLPGSSGEDFRALAPSPLRPLRAPCLVVWGEEDQALGQELIADTATYASALQVARIPRCSHWCQQDAVEEVIAAAARMLKVDSTSSLAEVKEKTSR
jgi:pimeloyl-ACP methyl ester carboxylesterase